jgi:proline dehydrogenase
VLAKYMPGETFEAAFAAAKRLSSQGITVTFTHLGENVEELAQADSVAEHCLEVIDRVADEGLDAELSVKLTHLGLDLDPEATFENLMRIVERAGLLENWVWIDMESTGYVDRTLDLYRRARESSSNVGICLQAYLRRTEEDVRKLLPLSPAIRLVKGAYREAPPLVFTTRDEINRSFLRLALQVLEAPRGGQLRLALGTHDVDLIQAVYRAARIRQLATDAVEIQMLYGIRTLDQLDLARRGRDVRVLIAYGSNWYPWFMRRLAERPANTLLVVRGLLEVFRQTVVGRS